MGSLYTSSCEVLIIMKIQAPKMTAFKRPGIA